MEIPFNIKEKYLHRRQIEIESIFKSLFLEDFSMALKFGHQVKGNAKTFNFPNMGELAESIEISALIKDRDAIVMYLEKFQLELFEEKRNLNGVGQFYPNEKFQNSPV